MAISHSSVFLSPAMSQLSKHNEIYSRYMLPLGHGFAPYVPEPGDELPAAYKQDGVDIGDILILLPDGGYDYLFNCTLPSNHPKNEQGVPANYQHFKIKPRNRRFIPNQHLADVPISSSGSQQTEIRVNAAVEAS
jgi:hypothetical protein